MERFALDRCHRPLRLPLLAGSALRKLPGGYFFENRFNLEHFFLLIDFAPS
jgi:hypothetical protein